MKWEVDIKYFCSIPKYDDCLKEKAELCAELGFLQTTFQLELLTNYGFSGLGILKTFSQK